MALAELVVHHVAPLLGPGQRGDAEQRSTPRSVGYSDEMAHASW